MYSKKFENINDVLALRLIEAPEAVVYSFERDNSKSVLEISFSDLDQKVRSVGASLQTKNLRGKRVLLALNHGPEFIYAFYACLALGAIAVPIVPPSKKKKNTKLQAVLNDASPALVLTHEDLVDVFENTIDYTLLEKPEVLDISRVQADASLFVPLEIKGDELAFLQYTSGSTGDPKGVMISHRNVLENAALTSNSTRTGKHSRAVIWLPFYHDMGLIGGVVHTMFVGASALLISPVSFVQQPIRWLQLMSEQRSTIIVAPNFALELCCDKVTDEQMATLDLSSVTCLLCGAEPVNAKTIRRFSEKFASCGFSNSAFMPSYGMAEATLYVSGTLYDSGPSIVALDAANLANNNVKDSEDSSNIRELVSNGNMDQGVAVVDPQTSCPLGEDQIGEVWISGKSVSKGYWQRPDLNREQFGALLKGNAAAGEFFKTGDLGFHRNGELYINGRIKDLIIIRAKNHYPQDLEDTATRGHEFLITGAAAAFSVDRGAGEELVLIAELSRQAVRAVKDEAAAHAVVDGIIQALSAQHEVSPSEILLLKPGRVLKTSSGKIQRSANKLAWLEQSVEPVFCWRQKVAIKQSVSSNSPVKMFGDRADIEAWLLDQLSQRCGVPKHEIALNRSFSSYGLDSLAAIELVGDINKRHDEHLQLDPTELWNYPTVDSLLDYLYPPTAPIKDQNSSKESKGSDSEPEELDLDSEVAALRALLGD